MYNANEWRPRENLRPASITKGRCRCSPRPEGRVAPCRPARARRAAPSAHKGEVTLLTSPREACCPRPPHASAQGGKKAQKI